MIKNNLDGEILHFKNYAMSLDSRKINIEKFVSINHRSGKFLFEKIPINLKNKHILDIGCGTGAISIFLAKRGAKVVGIDISPAMVKAARKLAVLHSVSKLITFKVGNIENIKYPPQTFDIVIGKSILHHVVFLKTINGIYRILKPKGIALFSEALSYNPLVKAYDSFMSNGLRSKGEKRLGIKEVKILEQKFAKVEWIGTDILSFMLFTLDFIYLKISKTKIPINWFERVEYGEVLNNTYMLIDKIEQVFPKIIQLLGWKIVIRCYK